MSNCSQSLTVFQLCSAVAMEIACKERARAVGAERQRDENTVNEQNECTVTWSVPNLEASSEEEVVSGGFSDDLCYEILPYERTGFAPEKCPSQVPYFL
ncbi:hypothetical protein PHYPO_G00002630 [Pangasianodon hypophthalmus]|uniref:Uncharacterized protein n=1 Tax=Pangasianodon hypophthalmus TaxID=310915 RepID=A0A5N5Q5R4_PANHP|nr:hypothetical protein PHYPO_G00002630 [Pangasianodon hypophthalmus]